LAYWADSIGRSSWSTEEKEYILIRKDVAHAGWEPHIDGRAVEPFGKSFGAGLRVSLAN